MTTAETKRLVAMLGATWPRQEIQQATLEVYAWALADLDFELAQAAVKRLVQTSRFFPTVAEIREAAIRGRVSLPAPEEAWGIVRRAIGRYGSYRKPSFDCDEIDAAVSDIGWGALCLAEEADPSHRARFCAAFAARASRRMDDEATGRYRPRARVLPPRDEELERGDVRVLVETGYATPRVVVSALAVSGSPELVATEFGAELVQGLADRLSRRDPEAP